MIIYRTLKKLKKSIFINKKNIFDILSQIINFFYLKLALNIIFGLILGKII
jgi:hypothetical protein